MSKRGKKKKKLKIKEKASDVEKEFDPVTGFTVPVYALNENLANIFIDSMATGNNTGESGVIKSVEEKTANLTSAILPAELITLSPARKANELPGTSVCFYFQVHQPFRLRNYNYDQIGHDHYYENYDMNVEILNKVADKCYLPTNAKILELLLRHKGRFKVAYSISGVALEQFELYRPDVILSFQALAATGYVEMLDETYYHSLSFLYSKDEFDRQVKMHREKIKKLFNLEPAIFRNTELIFNNDLAAHVASLGYKGMLCEGTDRYLVTRSPNQVYTAPGVENFSLLLKNYRLSDDIAFRFSNHNWEDWPLTADKFSKWLHDHAGQAETINLFMDYETFGEHQWKETGIFDFLDNLPEMILDHPDFYFRSPSEVISNHPPRDVYDAPEFTSWADEERDLSAWNENELQREALEKIYALEHAVKATDNEDLLKVWSKLQTSDHFYYMSTKFWADGDVHKYFSPFPSPYDAGIFYMNVISDLEKTILEQ
ncbi:MAG: glycoside hydrolase family 57 protein [Chitinophagales bacterium]